MYGDHLYLYHLYADDEGGGDLAREEEDVQHFPPRSLLLLRLHWIQHIVTNTGDYDYYVHIGDNNELSYCQKRHLRRMSQRKLFIAIYKWTGLDWMDWITGRGEV